MAESDALRERVARLFAGDASGLTLSVMSERQAERYRKLADEAIALIRPAVLEEAAAERDKLREALATAQTAIQDWCMQYAPEECGEDAVRETMQRITENAGTLAYISSVSEEIRTALALTRG